MRNILIYGCWAGVIALFYYAIASPAQHNPYDEEQCKKSCSTEVWSKDKCFSVCGEQYGGSNYGRTKRENEANEVKETTVN